MHIIDLLRDNPILIIVIVISLILLAFFKAPIGISNEPIRLYQSAIYFPIMFSTALIDIILFEILTADGVNELLTYFICFLATFIMYVCAYFLCFVIVKQPTDKREDK